MRGLAIGDRVSGEGHITCGHCRNCRAGRRHLCRNTQGVGVNRPGCFAEYMVLPASNVFRLPAGISDEIASILDPLGNATHAALSFNMVGEDVLITGAGPIGIMAVAIARFIGARHVVITDVNDYRLDLARRMGATRALNVTTREASTTRCASSAWRKASTSASRCPGNASAFRDMLRVMHHGGSIAMLGIPPARSRDRLEPGDLQGPRDQGHLRPRDVRDLVQDGGDAAERARRQRRDHAPLPGVGDYARAFETMGGGQSGKVILDWAA